MKRNVLSGLTFVLLLSAGSAFAQTPAPQGATCPDGRPAPCAPAAAGQAQPGAVQGGAAVDAGANAKAADKPAAMGGTDAQGGANTQGATGTPPVETPAQATDTPTQGQEAEDTEAAADAEGDANAEATGDAEAQADADVEVNLSTEQRTEITQVVREVNVEPVAVTSIDIEINIGVAVPQTIVLQPLPTRIVQIVPQYEGYLFFILDDGRIIIVAPQSHEIVLIIAA